MPANNNKNKEIYFQITDPDGNELTFYSADELQDWLSEVSNFHSINNQQLPDGNAIHSVVKRKIRELFNPALTELSNTVSNASINRNKVIAQQEAEKIFHGKRLIIPNSKTGRMISSLRNTDMLAGAYALLLATNTDGAILPNFTGTNQPALTPSAAKAAVAYSLLESGIATGYEDAIKQINSLGEKKISATLELIRREKESYDEIKENLSELIQKASEDHAEIEKIRSDGTSAIKLLKDTTKSFQNDLDKSESQLSNLLNNFNTKKSEMETDFRSLKENFENQTKEMEREFDRLKKAFESQVKVNAAYQYWKNKETLHRASSQQVLGEIKFYAGAVGFIILLIALVMSHSTISQTSIGGLMFISMSVLGVVWGGRVMARLYLSQIGLAEDASERATLVKTFIALAREGGAKDEQMDIVLNALCRPAPKGLGNDEGVPVLPIEAIIKRISG